MAKIKTINVKGTQIILFNKGNDEFISITDIARFKNATEPKDVVKNSQKDAQNVKVLNAVSLILGDVLNAMRKNVASLILGDVLNAKMNNVVNYSLGDVQH